MPHPPLATWEQEVVAYFANGAQALGFPPSVGQIYGLLYCRPAPLCLDEIVSLLDISKGSASQGLRQLRRVGAISPSRTEGNRKDYYTAEIKIRRILGGFLQKELLPQLERGRERIQQTAFHLEGLSPEDQAHARDRLKLLESWRTQVHRVLPFALAILGKR